MDGDRQLALAFFVLPTSNATERIIIVDFELEIFAALNDGDNAMLTFPDLKQTFSLGVELQEGVNGQYPRTKQRPEYIPQERLAATADDVSPAGRQTGPAKSSQPPSA